MKAQVWHVVNKADWGKGPWQVEPDKAQWQDADTGFPCLIVRNGMGGLCGYVGVTKAHPLYGLTFCDDRVGDALSVHGGVTFTDRCQPHDAGEDARAICHAVEAGEDDDVWWVGFDCSHSFDYSPRLEATHRQVGSSRRFAREVYRDWAYVLSECAALAAQLKAMEEQS